MLSLCRVLLIFQRTLTPCLWLWCGLSVIGLSLPLAKAENSEMRQIAEKELSVSDLVSEKSVGVKAELPKPVKVPAKNQYFFEFSVGTLRPSGRLALRDFQPFDLSDTDSSPLLSLGTTWKHSLTPSYALLTSAEVGLSSVRYDIVPNSNATTEQARLNTFVTGAWLGIQRSLGEEFGLAFITGARWFSYQQSATTDLATYSGTASNLNYGLRAYWNLSEFTSLSLGAFANSTLVSSDISETNDWSASLSVLRSL